MKLFQSVKYLPLLAAAAWLAACSPKVDTIGYVRDINGSDELVIGQMTREDVLAKFGSPSSRSNFGDETWYYITSRREAVGFLRPKIAAQDVTSIVFDDSGLIREVKHYDKADGRDFALAKRTTPTEGHSLGFLEQLLGNVGRFNNNSDSVAPGRRQR